MKKIIIVISCIITCLSATPDLQTSILEGILTTCVKKEFSFVEAIRLLHSGAIKRIRTAAPFVEQYKILTDHSPLISTEKIPLLPTFLYENFTKNLHKDDIIGIPVSAIAKLTAFLFPMHNGDFKANTLSSNFLGTEHGVRIVKEIVNFLTSNDFSDFSPQACMVGEIKLTRPLLTVEGGHPTKSLQEYLFKRCLKTEDLPAGGRGKYLASINEFIKTLKEALDEERTIEKGHDLIVNILMSYIWEKSDTYKKAKENLSIYTASDDAPTGIGPVISLTSVHPAGGPTVESVPTESVEDLEEKRIILELKGSDPSKLFPRKMEKVVLTFGARTHADCSEVTVRNFLNFVILNTDGSIKAEYTQLVSRSEFLRALYSSPADNLENDLATAQKWNTKLRTIPGLKYMLDNPGTEMATGFESFILALSVFLNIAPDLVKPSSLATQFNQICMKLSTPLTAINWSRKIGPPESLRDLDEVIVTITESDPTQRKKHKKFTIHQNAGHAYIS